MSIRPFYDRWPQYNRRLTEIVGAMTDEQLAIRPAPDLWPIWATVGHTAGGRVYWLCSVLSEPGADATPFSTTNDGWEDDLDHPRSASELVTALDTTWSIVDRVLDRWTPDMLVGGDRPVTVHVPASYEPGKPAPLLILLHAYGSTGSGHDRYFPVGAAAAERGFLYAYPDGTTDTSGNRFWSSKDACCDFDRTGVNDVAYLDSLITAIQAVLAVDPKRIDLIGHSSGGFMTYRMACTHADRIAAIASLAGATFANPADCGPSGPVAVLQIHGTA